MPEAPRTDQETIQETIVVGGRNAGVYRSWPEPSFGPVERKTIFFGRRKAKRRAPETPRRCRDHGKTDEEKQGQRNKRMLPIQLCPFTCRRASPDANANIDREPSAEGNEGIQTEEINPQMVLADPQAASIAAKTEPAVVPLVKFAAFKYDIEDDPFMDKPGSGSGTTTVDERGRLSLPLPPLELWGEIAAGERRNRNPSPSPKENWKKRAIMKGKARQKRRCESPPLEEAESHDSKRQDRTSGDSGVLLE